MRGHPGSYRPRILARALVLGTILAAPSAAATELTLGDTHVGLSGWLDVWDVIRLDDDTPHEDPSTTLTLAFQATHAKRFRLVARVDAGFDGKIGAPGGTNPVLPLDEIYTDRDLFLDFDEVYLETYLENVEVRIGAQKVSWGQLDEIQPTDHLNPEDLTEFFFRPELERKIAVPGIRVLGFRGPWTIDFVWNPLYTAYRFPNERDRWFPPLLDIPDVVETSIGPLPAHTRYLEIDRPARTLAHSDVGGRLTRFWRGGEFSLSLFHGFDKAATFGARTTADVTPTGDPAAPVDVLADIEIFPTLHRITALGFDMAIPVWLLALRAEFAWITGRFHPTLLQEELTSGEGALQVVEEAAMRVADSNVAERVNVPLGPAELERDMLQYGIGIDFVISELLSEELTGTTALAGTFILLQILDDVIFDHDSRLISDAVEHTLGFTYRQSFRDERLRAELKLAYVPNHGDYYVWPQLTYKVRPRCHLLLGARFIGGTRTQRIGQYRDYDGVRLGIRVFL